LIQSKVRRPKLASLFSHHPWRSAMTLDTILVVVAVTIMFATIGIVLAWGDKQTRNLQSPISLPGGGTAERRTAVRH
jgi:hypothetical protein